jgi:ABC-type proline/glycine betaine transport system ATPase subunit
VTHDDDEAQAIGDAVISYNDGRVTGQRTVGRPIDVEPPHEVPSSDEPS